MCLAIPMKIKEIKNEFARVEAGGFARTINIQMLPNVKAGDYVLVHAGFAIEKIDPEKARETLSLLDEPRTFFVFNDASIRKERGKDIARGK